MLKYFPSIKLSVFLGLITHTQIIELIKYF